VKLSFLPFAVVLTAFLQRRFRLAATASFAATLLVLLVHNGWFYGQLRFTSFVGRHLADRVFAFDGSLDPEDPSTKELLHALDSSGIPYEFPSMWWDYLLALRSDGRSPAEADALVLRAALAGIVAHPWRYGWNTVSVRRSTS
jgi:hypothetical protein